MLGQWFQMTILITRVCSLVPAGKDGVVQCGAAVGDRRNGCQVGPRVLRQAGSAFLSNDQVELIAIANAGWRSCVSGVKRSRSEGGSVAAFAGNEADEHVGDHASCRDVKTLNEVTGLLGLEPAIQTDARLAWNFDDASQAVNGHSRSDFDFFVRTNRPLI